MISKFRFCNITIRCPGIQICFPGIKIYVSRMKICCLGSKICACRTFVCFLAIMRGFSLQRWLGYPAWGFTGPKYGFPTLKFAPPTYFSLPYSCLLLCESPRTGQYLLETACVDDTNACVHMHLYAKRIRPLWSSSRALLDTAAKVAFQRFQPKGPLPFPICAAAPLAKLCLARMF